jgi:hypothetical protein
MEQMKASGRSAGEMIAYLMASLNTKYTGTLDEARNSLDGVRKAADDASGDAAKALTENYMGVLKVFNQIREGWWTVVEFFAKNPLTLSVTDNAAGAAKALAAKYLGDKKARPGEGPTSTADMIAKGNAVAAAAPETDEARKVRLDGEKKAADEEAKIHADLLKRKEAAALAYEEAQRDRAQKLEHRQRERLDANMWAQSMAPGSNARLENEARVLELNTEILAIKKEIAEEEKRAADEEKKAAEEEAKRAREQANTQNDARKARLVEQSQYTYHAARDKMTPEQQLAQTEANIKRWQKRISEAGDEEAKKGATDGLIGQLKERDRLQNEIADKADDRKSKAESLMTRDRDLLESAMTPEQRISESKKRAADLTKQLSGETDPDKKLALQSKLMDEAEKQHSLAKKKDTGYKSMSIGDVFEKGYGQARHKDPASEQVDISKEIRDLLKDIKAKKGGMAP